MANRKPKDPAPAEAPNVAVEPVKFSKAKILKLNKYANRRDALSAILKDDAEYTMDQVDTLITDFMKGKVK